MNELPKTDSTGTTSYAYDALGNLRRVDMPDGTLIEYVIDEKSGTGLRYSVEWRSETSISQVLLDRRGAASFARPRGLAWKLGS
jgi:YD repeat-containing protein